MWEMIQNMAGDRTWIYTSIAGSILGAVTLAYLSTTRIGLWGYAKFDLAVDYLVERWGLTWLEQPEDAWRKKYPHVTKKIDDLEDRIEELEEMAHPSKDLCEFAGFDDLETRIKELENELAKR